MESPDRNHHSCRPAICKEPIIPKMYQDMMTE